LDVPRKFLSLPTKQKRNTMNAVPPVLQTMEEALSDIDESEREFERGDVLSGDEFNVQCQALIDCMRMLPTIFVRQY
jgi:hypothetical protein